MVWPAPTPRSRAIAHSSVRVTKLRGSEYLNGQHRIAINSEGLRVFPRLEAAHATLVPTAHDAAARLALGVPGLDGMLAGGVPGAGTTLVVGTPIRPPAPGPNGRVPRRAVRELTERLKGEIQVLFDEAQVLAGRPNRH